jgi:hypothetical protein
MFGAASCSGEVEERWAAQLRPTARRERGGGRRLFVARAEGAARRLLCSPPHETEVVGIVSLLTHHRGLRDLLDVRAAVRRV